MHTASRALHPTERRTNLSLRSRAAHLALHQVQLALVVLGRPVQSTSVTLARFGAHSIAAEGRHPPPRGCPPAPTRSSAHPLRRLARDAQLGAEIATKVERLQRRGPPGALDRGDAPGANLIQLLTRGDRLRVPVGLRAARDRQPRGDGVRDGGRGNPYRRDPRGGRGRRHGPPRPASTRAAIQPASPPIGPRRP